MSQKNMPETKLQHLKDIERRQAGIFQNQAVQMEQKQRDLNNQSAAIEIRREQISSQFATEERRRVEQAFDFAVHSLPFWNRGVSAIRNRAMLLLYTMSAEASVLTGIREVKEQILIKEAELKAVAADFNRIAEEVKNQEPDFKE